MSEREDHLKQQREILKYSIEQFDKSVIYIASGSLAISFAFIKDIVTDFKCADSKWLLITSWIVFSSVIFISLIAHWISYMAHVWSIENDELEYEEYLKISKKWNFSIRSMNLSTIIGIFVGAVFLIIFINKNI
jgi:hypothetical protein